MRLIILFVYNYVIIWHKKRVSNNSTGCFFDNNHQRFIYDRVNSLISKS